MPQVNPRINAIGHATQSQRDTALSRDFDLGLKSVSRRRGQQSTWLLVMTTLLLVVSYLYRRFLAGPQEPALSA